MAMVRLSVAAILVAACCAQAAGAEPVTEKKKPAVSEQNFHVPLDFKTRSDLNVGDSASIPSGRLENLSVDRKTFFGLGVTQPFGSTK
jgi:hypothetical protein